MYISRFQVRNYKSFWQPEAIDLKPGFNIVTGQNSSGKTALLEALSLSFDYNPHRSLTTLPSPDTALGGASCVDFTFSVDREELFDLLAAKAQNYFLPLPLASCALTPGYDLAQRGQKAILDFVEHLLARDSQAFSLRMQVGSGRGFQCPALPTLGLYPPTRAPGGGPNLASIVFRLNADRSIAIGGTGLASSDLGLQLAPAFQSHIYRFRAERFNVGECPFGDNPTLSAQAANLPEALNCLQANLDAFDHFNALVNKTLPHVRSVSVRPSGNGRLQIIVWTIDPATRRVDLARPLSESGTGIGQVLAILYVAMTALRPQVLLIDEPQSFLHPGAIRKLVEILRDHSEHQYVIATHSPAVISSCDPATITLARLSAEESTLQQVDPDAAKSLQLCLSEVGARLADVFGADNVLWVEGRTEERCFPRILRGVVGRSLLGTAILGIRSTGDLAGRDAERAFETLERLSQGPSLLPPTIGIVLDSECRTEGERQDMRRRRGGPVHFLPRRMYENYLLDPDAIATTLNHLDESRAEPLGPAEAGAALDELRRDEKYFCTAEAALDEEAWLVNVDGASLLRDTFARLSEARVEYRKVRDSTALTDWMIENKRDSLSELAEFLARALDDRQRR